MIRQILEVKKFTPILAKDDHRAQPLSLPIFQAICSSCHAIVDFSSGGLPEEKGSVNGLSPTGGVLMENGFLRSTLPANNILHVVDFDTKLPAEAQALKYTRYRDLDELGRIVATWLEELLNERHATERLLLSRHNVHRTDIWYHCDTPTANPKSRRFLDAPWGAALSGGGTGSELLRRVVRAIDSCYSVVMHPPTAQDSKDCHTRSELVCRASKGNLLLLDAPIGLNGDLNWVAKMILTECQKELVSRLSVRFRFLKQSEKANSSEEKCIDYRGGKRCVSTPQDDYGAVWRVPNPFCEGSFALVMAGIHAPASYGAAAVVATPPQARRLIDELGLREELPDEELFFEAVFKIKRTYLIEDLNSPEWIFAQQLHTKANSE